MFVSFGGLTEKIKTCVVQQVQLSSARLKECCNSVTEDGLQEVIRQRSRGELLSLLQRVTMIKATKSGTGSELS